MPAYLYPVRFSHYLLKKLGTESVQIFNQDHVFLHFWRFEDTRVSHVSIPLNLSNVILDRIAGV